MSSESTPEVSFDTLLGALEAVKAEVAGLATGLKSAEARIERLEAFTFFTPPESPVLSPESTKVMQQPAGTNQPTRNGKANDLAPIEEVIRSSLEEAFNKRDSRATQQAEEINSAERPVDIQQHLQPINSGIESLAKHLERIELSIGLLHKNSTPSPSITVKTSPPVSPALSAPLTPAREAVSPKETTEPTNLPRSGLPTPLLSSKIRGRSSVSPSTPSLPSELPRLVFGQTSTPTKRRPVSLNVASSPYGNYADEKSPFSQFSGRRSSSVLSNGERSISPLNIQETPEDCKLGSSLPKSKLKD